MANDTNENLEYLDILRVMAICGVVFTHVASSILFSAKPLTSVAWWIGNVSVSASRWCVPTFVMISGALHLDPSRNMPVLSFWKKRVNRILIPLIFWTLFYLGYRSLFGELSRRDIVHDLLLGTPFYHLWFLYMIAGLYLVTPFLQTYVKHASSKERILLIISIFVLANCSYSLNSLYFKNDSMIFTLFIPFLAYYICGYEMSLLNHDRFSYKYLIPLMLACVLGVAIGTAVLMKLFNVPRCMLLYGYFSLPVIVMSGIVFWSIRSLSNAREGIHRVMKQLIASMKPTTFGIYLLHAAVLHIAIQVIGQQTVNRHSLIAILVLTILILFICHMLVLCIMKLLYVRKIVV